MKTQHKLPESSGSLLRKELFDKELRTLKGLLADYNEMLDNHNMTTCNNTTSLKRLLQKQFGNILGFHKRYHANKSTIVYDTTCGGSYVESAMYS